MLNKLYILKYKVYKFLMTKSSSKTPIKSNLHVFRAQERITQDELAKIVGVTRATIIAIEKENYNPSLELAFRLAKHFKVQIEDIFTLGVENGNE